LWHRLAVSFGGRSSSVEADARAGAKVKEWRPERGERTLEREVIFSRAKSANGKKYKREEEEQDVECVRG